MIKIDELKITPVSMVTKENLQMIVLDYICSKAEHLWLTVYKDNNPIAKAPIAFDGGKGRTDVLLPMQDNEFEALWEISDKDGNSVFETAAVWKKPIERTIYVMVSSHTDIGLHNSQYIQRYNSSRFIDEAINICDKYNDGDKYRYTIEGTWFWNNYGMDRGRDKAQYIADNYIKKGKLGMCCGVAGNHIQTYGLEEMCRSAYEKKRLYNQCGIESETISMIDNNGLDMAMIQPYAEAGYKNVIFSPNQWNPIKSGIWKMDMTHPSCTWSPQAGGGGSRIDVRFSSELPMVFYWEGEDERRILVWCSTHYDFGGEMFGLESLIPFDESVVRKMEQRNCDILPLLDKKYPYSVWLTSSYGDDEQPNTNIIDAIKAWNRKWKTPVFRTLGNPDEPFNELRMRHNDEIPVIKGDITGGWYQHPISVPELLAQKFEADRLLPTAEKWSVIAALLDDKYSYPTEGFRRAWDYLLYNDEHSYGTSGYQGRRVYETWLQHIDWIDKAVAAAENESKKALESIAKNIYSEGEVVAVFNPTLQTREEYIEIEDKYAKTIVPPMGYSLIGKNDLMPAPKQSRKTKTPPVIENKYYKISFSENGSVKSITDKELNRELIDTDNQYRANELVYTNDNHKTFFVPHEAEFEVIETPYKITVAISSFEEHLGAEIKQTVTLPENEKRIDIDNRLYHVRDMVNTNRYYRYIYFAFPFAVENSKRYCHLNGNVAEYAKTLTGHGTDVYMAVNEWCCAENDKFGTALMMKDSQLVEFDRIHSDKTDFGNAGCGSQIFVYAANDWLQMHTVGGSHLNYIFRFSITSYKGGYKAAKIPQMSEKYVNPVQCVKIKAQNGVWKEASKSIFDVDCNMRLIGLKRADDGDGIIARFYGHEKDTVIDNIAGISVKTVRNTVDERLYNGTVRRGFVTYRLQNDKIKIHEREAESEYKKSKPAPIGSVYTGLITRPRAIRGENSGHLYLLWGYNNEKNFSHYKLYRSESPNFEISNDTFIADVKPEEYVVGRYEDTGLKPHTCYYYKVFAVNTDGAAGEVSEEFSAFTKEED